MDVSGDVGNSVGVLVGVGVPSRLSGLPLDGKYRVIGWLLDVSSPNSSEKKPLMCMRHIE